MTGGRDDARGGSAAAPGCFFCRIAAGEIPAREIFRDERIVAFQDVNPQAPVHALIVPVPHVATLDDLEEADAGMAGEVVLRATRLARELGVARSGYRLVWNCGDDGGQTVSHLHLHLLGGRRLRWPPG